MSNEDLLMSIAQLRRGSRATMSMVLLGVAFLIATVIYSATRLQPLQEEINVKRNEIAQLEARKMELARIVEATEDLARPVAAAQPQVGWVYLGRVSSAGDWAPRSDRVNALTIPASIQKNGEIGIQQNASLVSSFEGQEGSTSPPNSKASQMLFIRPGTKLRIDDVREQASIGGGKLLWVKVKVPADALLQVGA